MCISAWQQKSVHAHMHGCVCGCAYDYKHVSVHVIVYEYLRMCVCVCKCLLVHVCWHVCTTESLSMYCDFYPLLAQHESTPNSNPPAQKGFWGLKLTANSKDT